MSNLPAPRTATKDPVACETRIVQPPAPVHHQAVVEHGTTECTCHTHVEHHAVVVPAQRHIPTVFTDYGLPIVLFVVALAFAVAAIFSFGWGVAEHLVSCGHQTGETWLGRPYSEDSCTYERGGWSYVLLSVPIGAVAVLIGMFATQTLWTAQGRRRDGVR